MTNPRENSLAALLLVQRLVDATAAPLKATEYWQVLDAVPDPADLLTMGAAAIAAAGIDPALAQRVTELLDAATAVAFRLDDFERSGLRVVTSVDADYPSSLGVRLGRAAPPVLYAVGDLQLLATGLLGVVGSRDVAPVTTDVTREVAAAAVTHGLGVVSGGAKGTDRLAMQAALEAGGNAVGVVADSLERTVRDPEIRHALNDGRLCLCTPYKPTAAFSVANAMGRNKIIYALSNATIVVASDLERGGTWSGAVEALRHGSVPVLVWTGEGGGPGNAALAARGAVAVASLSSLFPLPARATSPEAARHQLALDM